LSRRSIAKAELLARVGSTCYNTPMSKLEVNPHKSVHNLDFALGNIIAAEIEKVIGALRSVAASIGEKARVRCRFSARFTKKLDRFCLANEHAAGSSY
jgi:hypothetical protein